MRSKAMFTLLGCLFGLTIMLSQAAAQQRPVTVPEIPGVVAAGTKWQIAAVTFVNADGIIGAPDGSVMWASQPASRVSGLDKDGREKIFWENTNGAGAIGFASNGQVFAMMRDVPALGLLAPEKKILMDNYQGDKFKGASDIVVDKKGGIYFTESGRTPFPGVYYYSPEGKLTSLADGIRANGIMLSPDERTLYVTNRQSIVAFDVQPDGMVSKQREFCKLEGNGAADGTAIDAAGRLYVAADPGIQVFSPEGKYLGSIPTPRPLNSLAFGGPGKKWIFIVGNGAVDAEGKQHPGSPAKTIYKISTLTEGFKGRAK